MGSGHNYVDSINVEVVLISTTWLARG